MEQKARYASTMGGLDVNNNLQVMNKDGNPIAGLYAAGEIIGGVMGSDSPSGANNGWAVTSGSTLQRRLLNNKNERNYNLSFFSSNLIFKKPSRIPVFDMSIRFA